MKHNFKYNQGSYIRLQVFLLSILVVGCSSFDGELPMEEEDVVVIPKPTLVAPEPEPEYADIDFSNWKLTLPVDENNNGSPDEYHPEDLIDLGYQSNEHIQPYMYDDESDESIVFYTYPAVSTRNSSYSRTELRELINPDNARENWTLKEGGVMKGKLKVASMSNDSESSNEYHRVIVMQIHGIISIEDMEKHGFSSNNGPPLIKIYWKDGDIWCHKKSLVDENTSGDNLIQPYSSSNKFWTDDKDNLGFVGNEAFDFRITASEAKIEVQLNENEPVVYQDISLDKWTYENYFKAGNYLNSRSADAESYIKYYELSVTH